jgi:hypothetical protein
MPTLSAALLLLAAALAPSLAGAQAVATLPELRKTTDQIMEQVGKGHIEEGFKIMKPRTVIPPAEFDAMVGQAKLQLPAMNQRFGGNLGHAFLREDKVGEFLVRYTYIHRLEKHAMRWLFFGYRGKSGWTINTFRFDDQIHLLFE